MKTIWKIYIRLRFGKIKEVITEVINGSVSEAKYYASNGDLVGYWGYGYWNPSYPYRGQDL